MGFHSSYILTLGVLAAASFLSIAHGGYVIQQAVQPFPGRVKTYASPPHRTRPTSIPTKTYPRSPPAYAAENQILVQAIKQALRSQGALGQRSPATSDIEIHRAKLSEQFVLPQIRQNSPVVVQNYVVQPPSGVSGGYETKSQKTQWTPISPVRSTLPNRNIVQYRHSEVKSPAPAQSHPNNQGVRSDTKHANNFIPQAIQIANSYEVPDDNTNNFNSQSFEEVKFVEERPQQQVVYRVEAKNQVQQQFNTQSSQPAADPVQSFINISPSDPSQVLQGTSGYISPPSTTNQVVQVSQVQTTQPQVTTTIINNQVIGVSPATPVRQPENQGYSNGPVSNSQQQQGQVKVHTTYEFYKHSEPQIITPEVITPQPEQNIKQQSTSSQFQSQPVNTLSAEQEFPFPTVSIASDTPQEAPVTTYEPQVQLQEVSVNSQQQVNQAQYSQPQQNVKQTQSSGYSTTPLQQLEYTVFQPQKIVLQQSNQFTAQSQQYVVPQLQKQISQPQSVLKSQVQVQKEVSQPQVNQVANSQSQQNVNQPQSQGYDASPQPQQNSNQPQGYATPEQPQPSSSQQPEPPSVNKANNNQQYTVSQPQKVVLQLSNKIAPQPQQYVVSQQEQSVPKVQQQIIQLQNVPEPQFQLQAVNVNTNQPQNVRQVIYSQPLTAFIPVQQQQQYILSQSPQFVIPESQAQQYAVFQPQQVSIQLQQVAVPEQPQSDGYISTQPEATVPNSEGYSVQSQNSIVPDQQQYQQQQYVVNVVSQPQQVELQNQQPQFQQVLVTQQSPDQIVPQFEQTAPISQSELVFQPQQNEIQVETQQQYDVPQPQQQIVQQISNSEPQQYNNAASQPEPLQQVVTRSQSSPVTITEPIVNTHQEVQVQAASTHPESAPPPSDADQSPNLVFVNTEMQPSGEAPRQPIAQISSPSGQENEQIIVVRTPNQMATQTTYQVEIAPSPSQDTKVYVLQPQPEVNHEVTVTHPQQTKQPDPEIRFVRYADSDILPHQTVSEFNRVTEQRGPTAKTYDMYAPQMPHEIYYTHPVYS